LVKYRALRDAGMSREGSLEYVIGLPDGTRSDDLGPVGQEAVDGAVEAYRRQHPPDAS
jgi:hypothetical protein